MELTIITPIGKEKIGIDWIQVETEKGSLMIYPGHAPLLCSLKTRSEITFFEHGHLNHRTITEGFMHVERHTVMLILEAV